MNGESPDLWKLIKNWVWRRFGLTGLLVLSCLGIWWQWDHIRKLPGIESLVATLAEKPLPKAVPSKFNIAVVHLEGDSDHETERLIRESLAEFPGVVTLSFDRLISDGLGDTGKDERTGHERARILLKASGADVLIWGLVLKKDGKTVPKLYWTPSRQLAQMPSSRRYLTTENLSLPNLFWQDLTSVLGLLVVATKAEFFAKGQDEENRLALFIQRIRELLRSSKAEQWNAVSRAEVLDIFGYCAYIVRWTLWQE